MGRYGVISGDCRFPSNLRREGGVKRSDRCLGQRSYSKSAKTSWTADFRPARSACGIHTQGDTIDDLRRNVREAVDCYFDDDIARPRLIRLHYVRDEVLVA